MPHVPGACEPMPHVPGAGETASHEPRSGDEQRDARDRGRDVHPALGQHSRVVEQPERDGQRNAVVRVTQTGDDLRDVGGEQPMDRMPFVVDRDLAIQLPDAQRDARHECGGSQEQPGGLQ